MIVFIPGNIPSSKNSKTWTGKHLINSKTVSKYLKANLHFWTDEKTIKSFRELYNSLNKPVTIGFHFVRDSKRKYDWVNMVQLPQDLMVKNGWIDDDNTDCMYPWPLMINGVYTTYDKQNPGVYIELKEE